jgi:hypothetical protein
VLGAGGEGWRRMQGSISRLHLGPDALGMHCISQIAMYMFISN